MRIPLRRQSSQRAPAPFVVGVGRSGTTLLRLMLDAHPELAIPPETHFIPALIKAAEQGKTRPRQFLRVVTAERRFGDFGINPDDLLERWRELRPLDAADAIRAFFELYAEQAGKPRWGDKTPGYTIQMERIAGTLPEARFIHLVRDGRDVALSRVTSLVQRPRTVSDAAERWRKRILEARSQGERIDHYLEVRYEDLVGDTEPVLRRICEFVELGFDPQMLAYHERAADRLSELDRDLPATDERLERSAEDRLALHAHTAKPPDPARIGRWRRDMSEADVAAFEQVAGDVLGELGYERS
jgi:hypothetical protein